MKTSKVSWKIENVAKKDTNGKINFDLVIQRKKNIWDLKRKSKLVHSILVGYPIPAVFATKENTVYHILDGKQRLTCIFDFRKDEFALDLSTPAVNGIEIAGKKFSELPPEMQQAFENYEIDLNKLEDITVEEVEELFFRLNNGVPLRTIETIRAILGGKVLRFVEDIASMDFFASKINLSKVAKQRYTDQELVLQILTLVKNHDTGFSSKEIGAFVETKLRNTDIQDELRSKMQNACYYLNEAFAIKEKFLKKLHVPMLFKLVLDLQEQRKLITPKEFAVWAVNFFDEQPEEYSSACNSGSARKENVQKRLSVMTTSFNKYFADSIVVPSEVPSQEESA